MNPIITPLLIAIVLTAGICWLIFHYLQQKSQARNAEVFQQQSIAFARLQKEQQELQNQKDNLLERSTAAETRSSYLQEQYLLFGQLQQEHQQLQNKFTASQSSLKHAEEKLLHQVEEMNQLGEKFRFEFRSLAQSILEEKSARFSELNEQKMNAILSPLKVQIGEFKQKVEDTYDKESKERFSLGKEVERLISMTQQVSLEANNLTTALKGNNKMQGNWGEIILESLLENSGLTRNREYFIQEFIRDNANNIIKDENGKGLQPDVMIVYPDQRKVIIDSKVSLLAWEEAVSQPDVGEQRRLLSDHVKSIRLHIDGLAKKNYPKYASALDYVLMFIPIEPAFLEALKQMSNSGNMLTIKIFYW